MGFKVPWTLVFWIKRKWLLRKGTSQVLHKVQKEMKREIRVGKLKYKDKIETQFRMNNLGSAWDSMKTIVGLKE